MHDLAHAHWQSVIRDAGIDPLLLLHAVDRALLIDLLSYDEALKLRGVSIRTASGLAKYLGEGPDHESLVRDALGVKDVSPFTDLLAAKANVSFLVDSLPRMAREFAKRCEAEAARSPPAAPPVREQKAARPPSKSRVSEHEEEAVDEPAS